MKKISIGSTAAFVALTISGCMASPVVEEENIGIDSEALSAGGDCPFPPEYPPTDFPPPPPPPLGCPDYDYDGLCDDYDDLCLGTEIPEIVPLRGLAVNHFALKTGAIIGPDIVFDTRLPNGRLGPSEFTIWDTGGCSCEQILYALGGRYGQYKNGCSYGTMKQWVRFVNGF
jgi:hypothetical protein